MALEDAELTVGRIVKAIDPGSCYAEQWDAVKVIIEARDAAVALAALDEVRTQASLDTFNIPESNAIIRAVEAVRAKYAAKVGG